MLAPDDKRKIDQFIGEVHYDVNLMEKIRQWVMSRIDLYGSFDGIPEQKKESIRTAISNSVYLFQSFSSPDTLYEYFVSL